MKYGLLKYAENKNCFNIGDYIQSLAAKQFLPQVGEYINREALAVYKGEKIKMILNGWFTHNISNWVPSDNIDPLFISFHINSTAAPFLLNDKAINYLKKYEPIGCRDHFTLDILTRKGIKAYFSGCLTLTLDSYKVKNILKEDKIYIVDPLYGYITIKKITTDYKAFIKSILDRSIFDLGKK
ncbi:MAG: polysaccharide pyruvyl transferase family protein [Bacteroides sp.]|nr:polysaccharide pyruvyl transferase family protein [Bacteroides sp.]